MFFIDQYLCLQAFHLCCSCHLYAKSGTNDYSYGVLDMSQYSKCHDLTSYEVMVILVVLYSDATTTLTV